MHFVLPVFLLFLSLFHPSEACLKVESSITTTTTVTTTIVTTTTAIPSCNNCLFVRLDADNIETYIGDHPSYPNIRKHGVIPPKVQRDECSLSIACPSNYTLVALSDTNYQTFDQFSLEAVCNKFSGQWTIGGTEDYAEIFAQLYGVCVKFTSACPCSWEILNNENAGNLIGGSLFYQQLIWGPSKYQPKISYDGNGCPSHFDCAPSTVSWYFDLKSYEVNEAQADVTCNTDTLTWDTHTDRALTTKQFYPICYWYDELYINCQCKINSINENFGTTFYKDYPFLMDNATFYRYYTADLHVPETGCVTHVTCEAGQTLMILGDSTTEVPSGEAFVECSDDKWTITYDNKVVKERPDIQITCVDYKEQTRCLCTIDTFDMSLGSFYYQVYPELEAEVSGYNYFPAQFSDVGEDKCVQKGVCPRHLSLFAMGRFKKTAEIPEFNMDCSTTKQVSWITVFDKGSSYVGMGRHMTVLCVDFARKLDCPCLIETVSYFAGDIYTDDYPFLKNDSYWGWFPAELQKGANGCMEKASCLTNRTMVIMGNENAVAKSHVASFTCSGNDGVSLSYDGITRQERSEILIVCMEPKK